MSEPRDLPDRIVVAGDGQVGALAAIALKRALPSCDVLVIGTPAEGTVEETDENLRYAQHITLQAADETLLLEHPHLRG